MSKYEKVVVIGTGLIGGSAGKSLIKKKLAREVVGICRRRSSAEAAMREKAVTTAVVGDYPRHCAGADIVLVSTPVASISGIVKEISGHISCRGLIVTDAGSVKKEIVRDLSRFGRGVRFVGSHPMAGSERSGVESSRHDLFDGSVCVLTPVKSTCPRANKKVAEFWRCLGAKVLEMSPSEHDREVALSSHLPHLAAYALAGTIGKRYHESLFAGGFRDTSRVASSEPSLWAEIFKMNSADLLKVLDRYRHSLDRIEKDILSGDKKKIKSRLEKWKKVRDDIFEKNKSDSHRRSGRKR